MTERKTANPMRDLRVSLGLTQDAMALRLRCCTRTVRACEYQSRVPSQLAILEHFKELQNEAGGGDVG